MSGHADTALDQLRLADSCANDLRLSRSDEHLGYLAKAVVHALLEVAAAVREENQVMDSAIVEWDRFYNRP